MAASLAKGDPAEGSVISQSARGMAAALFTKAKETLHRDG